MACKIWKLPIFINHEKQENSIYADDESHASIFSNSFERNYNLWLVLGEYLVLVLLLTIRWNYELYVYTLSSSFLGQKSKSYLCDFLFWYIGMQANWIKPVSHNKIILIWVICSDTSDCEIIEKLMIAIISCKSDQSDGILAAHVSKTYVVYGSNFEKYMVEVIFLSKRFLSIRLIKIKCLFMLNTFLTCWIWISVKSVWWPRKIYELLILSRQLCSV